MVIDQSSLIEDTAPMVPNLNLSQECVCFLCPGGKGTLTSGVAGACLTTYVEHGTSLFNVTGVRVRVCVWEHAESDTTVNHAERPREVRPVSHNAVCVQKGCGRRGTTQVTLLLRNLGNGAVL